VTNPEKIASSTEAVEFAETVTVRVTVPTSLCSATS
jgi:hypothetical protein